MTSLDTEFSYEPVHLSDVVVHYQGCSFSVHRYVLHTQSGFFDAALRCVMSAEKDEHCGHPHTGRCVTLLDDCVEGGTALDLRDLFDCMYDHRATASAPYLPLAPEVTCQPKKVHLVLVALAHYLDCAELLMDFHDQLSFVSVVHREGDMSQEVRACKIAFPTLLEHITQSIVDDCMTHLSRRIMPDDHPSYTSVKDAVRAIIEGQIAREDPDVWYRAKTTQMAERAAQTAGVLRRKKKRNHEELRRLSMDELGAMLKKAKVPDVENILRWDRIAKVAEMDLLSHD